MSKTGQAKADKVNTEQPQVQPADEEKGLYQDEFIKITREHLIIFSYYFPMGTSKSIEISKITAVELRDSAGVHTSWGISRAHLHTWFHQDKDRKNKHKYISVAVQGKKMKCGLTPAMIIKAYEALMEVCKFNKFNVGEQETYAGMVEQQENLKIQDQ